MKKVIEGNLKEGQQVEPNIEYHTTQSLVRRIIISKPFKNFIVNFIFLIMLLILSFCLSKKTQLKICSVQPKTTPVYYSIYIPKNSSYDLLTTYKEKDDNSGQAIRHFKYKDKTFYVKTNRIFSQTYLEELPITTKGSIEGNEHGTPKYNIKDPLSEIDVYDEQYILDIVKMEENRGNLMLGNILNYTMFIQILICTCIGNIIIILLPCLFSSFVWFKQQLIYFLNR